MAIISSALRPVCYDRSVRSYVLLLAVLAACAPPARAQAPERHVTTAHALAAHSHFFHGAHLTFLGTVHEMSGLPVVPIGEKRRAVVFWQTPQRPDGIVVLSGTFLDLGRLEAGDPRLTMIDVQRILDMMNGGRWPARDQLFLLASARAETYEPAGQPSLRAIALDPARYAGRNVTLSGRFRGRNLFGDQPVSPGKSPHEYVIRVADASIWISGPRPRGRGFTLDADSRRDTREWVRVAGVVRHEPPLAWIEGKSIDLTKPEADAARVEPPSAPAQGPPPEVVFSAPLDGESDVAVDTVVRVQFSRDIAPDSLRNQVAVAYGMRADGAPPGAAPAAHVTYRASNRSIEIRFDEPLAPFTPVIVAFGNGITATDGAAMRPARISFVTGGSR